MTEALRILGTGSRDLRDWTLVRATLLDVLTIASIGPPILVHGGQMSRDKTTGECYGADYLLDQVWRELAGQRPGWLQKPEVHPAAWTAPCRAECEPDHRRPRGGGDYCPAQGNYRNATMVERGATVCVAFPLPGSRGTWDCVGRARDAGIPTRIIITPAGQVRGAS